MKELIVETPAGASSEREIAEAASAPLCPARPKTMCNLYSITTNQATIIALFRVINRYVGNLQPMPGVFPDFPAPPVIRNSDGGREMLMMRWGMPPPPRTGGPPVTNIRNTSSPHWRVWVRPENRCLVLATEEPARRVGEVREGVPLRGPLREVVVEPVTQQERDEKRP